MRRSFSILSLLLLIALAGVLCAWWLEGKNTAAVTEKLKQTQARLELHEGHLDIDDSSKAHAVAVKDLVQPRMRWKWRVYLPPGKKYRLHWTDFDIPADGIIKAENNEPDRSYGGSTEYSGEFVVEFSVHLGFDGKWWMALAANDENLMSGDWSFWNDAIEEFPLDRTQFPMNFKDGASLLPKHGTRVFDKDVLLLHAMYPDEEYDNTGPGCAPGFALWLEELEDVSEKASAPAVPAIAEPADVWQFDQTFDVKIEWDSKEITRVRYIRVPSKQHTKSIAERGFSENRLASLQQRVTELGRSYYPELGRDLDRGHKVYDTIENGDEIKVTRVKTIINQTRIIQRFIVFELSSKDDQTELISLAITPKILQDGKLRLTFPDDASDR